MDDLDDLLGGPSNNANNKEIDDLLGDAPTPSSSAAANSNKNGGGLAAFDDDLFGGPPSASAAAAGGGGGGDFDDDLLGGSVSNGVPPPATTSAAAAAGPNGFSPVANRVDPRLQKDNKYNPQPGGRKRAVGTIKAAACTASDLPTALAPYLCSLPDVYCLRAVSVIDCSAANMNHSSSARYEAPPQRTRMIIRVTSSTIALFSPNLYDIAVSHSLPSMAEPKPLREVPIDTVFGITMQQVVVPKLFGARETELQVLIQIKEDADILLAITRDAANGPVIGAAEHDADLIQCLSAVTFAYGITLPVATLHEGEMIEKLMNRHVGKRGDERLRHRQVEQLAYRSDLTEERKRLQSEIETMTVEIEKLKVSEIAKTADQIQTDISEHEKAIAQFRKNVASLEEMRRRLEGELSGLNARIKAEATRREKAAKESMADAQHEAFKRQVAEFEQMKNAHKRDMDKLSNLIAFEERRIAARGNAAGFNGVLEITDRLEDLEAQDKFLEDQLSRGHSNHTRQMEVLAIAKKETLPAGRDKLQNILDEIKLLQQLKERMDFEGDARIKAQPGLYNSLLSSVGRDKPATLTLPTVKEPEVAVAEEVIPPPPAPAAPVADTPKPTVSLDDSDDEDLVVVPKPAAPVAAPKPAISLDDDDEI